MTKVAAEVETVTTIGSAPPTTIAEVKKSATEIAPAESETIATASEE